MSHPRDCKSDWTTLKVTELQRGLRMVDAKTGERVRDIKGAEMADLDRFIGSHRGVDYGPRVIAVSDTGVEISEAPWAGRNLELLDMAVLDGDIYAYLGNESAREGPVVYRTTDGTTWTELGSEALPGSIPSDASIDIVTWPGRVFITSHGDGARADWVSADGVTWEPGPTDPPEGASLVALPTGWFAAEVLPGYKGHLGDTAWMYAGGEWVSLDPLGFDCTEVDGGTRTSWGAVGDTTFIGAHHDCGPLGRAAVPDLWILSPGS